MIPFGRSVARQVSARRRVGRFPTNANRSVAKRLPNHHRPTPQLCPERIGRESAEFLGRFSVSFALVIGSRVLIGAAAQNLMKRYAGERLQQGPQCKRGAEDRPHAAGYIKSCASRWIPTWQENLLLTAYDLLLTAVPMFRKLLTIFFLLHLARAEARGSLFNSLFKHQ